MMYFNTLKTASKISLIVTILAGMGMNQAQGANQFGQASDLFNVGAGARSMAMGGAFTALSDDASAPYYNPAGLAYLDEQGRITVQVAGQWTHEDQEQIAHALNIPIEQVRVIYPAIGGAFGGREDMSVQIVLALAVQRLKRPIKIIWTREESIIGHHKRHPFWFHAKLGAKRDGTLVAAEINLMSDAGPYNYTSNKVLGNATVTCTGPYEIPNVSIDARAVVTNNVRQSSWHCAATAPRHHWAGRQPVANGQPGLALS